MHIQDKFEELALKGDGQFAIAYALLALADAQKASAKALANIGLSDGDTPGALEFIGMTLHDTLPDLVRALTQDD